MIGALKNEEFEFNEKKYTLPRHGFAREKEFEIIANKIADVLDNINDEALHAKIKDEMKALASNFIIYDRPTY